MDGCLSVWGKILILEFRSFEMVVNHEMAKDWHSILSAVRGAKQKSIE